jgi:hypothetical protein
MVLLLRMLLLLLLLQLLLDRFHNKHGIAILIPSTLCCNIKRLAFLKSTRILKISIDQLQMLPIIHLQPHGNRLGRKTSIALRYNHLPTRFEHTMHLLQHLNRMNQIINRYDTRHHIKRFIGVQELWLNVQILRNVIGQLIIRLEFQGIHPRSTDPLHYLWKFQWVVTHPRRTNVQYAAVGWYGLSIILRERGHSGFVNVIDKSWNGVEASIVLLVGSQEIFRSKGRSLRPGPDESDGSDWKGPGGVITREASYEESSSARITIRSVGVFHLNFGINVSRILGIQKIDHFRRGGGG